MKRKTNQPTAVPAPGRRLFFRRLSLIGAGALLLRLAVSAELAAANGGRNSVFMPPTATDLATYLKLADDILQGTFALPFYYQPFYYAVFLPAVRLVSGSPWLLIAVQSLLGSAACVLAGLTAAQAWSRRAGLWTAGLCAVSAPLLLYTPFAMNETLQSFWFALLAFLAVKLLKRPGTRLAAATGAVWGCAVLTRGNALLFGLILLVLTIRRRAWKTGIAVAAVCALVQAPFIVLNSVHLGRFSGPSTAADAVLALGNTPEAPPGGRNPGLPAGPMEYPETYADFMARSTERSVPLQMFDFLRREPAAFLELQFRKLALFWTGDEIPNNVSLYGEGQCSVLLRLDLPGRSSVLLALALAGLFALLPRLKQDRWIVLYGMVAIYWGATALFYDLSRFRAPILPAAFVFAGCFLDRAILRRRLAKPMLTGTVLPLALGVFCVNSAYDFYRTHCEAAVHRFCRPDGIVYEKQDGSLLRLDHGPFSFGGWELVPLKPGMRLEKRFTRVPAGKRATLRWTFRLPQGGILRGRLDGVPFELDRAGLTELCAEIRSGETVVVELDEVSPDVSAIMDTQRQYGRSLLSGEVLPGEYIVRMNLPEGKSENDAAQ